MALYSKQTWLDRVVQYARRFTKSDDGTYLTLTPSPGTITAEGTPIESTRLNHIEDGIESAHLNRAVYHDFADLLSDGTITHIKLIGDSVTAGADATDWNVSPTTNYLGITGAYEMNHTPPSFANLFRAYVAAKYPTVGFLNAGINGLSMKSAHDYLTTWVGAGNDTIFLILGINDGSQSASLAAFEGYAEEVIQHCLVQTNCHRLYVCSTPCLGMADTTGTNGSTIHDRNHVLRKLAQKYGVPFVDLYQETIRVCSDLGVNLAIGDYYLDDETHPADRGHKMIWIALQRLLGLIDTQADQEGGTIETATIALQNSFVAGSATYMTNLRRVKNMVEMQICLKDGTPAATSSTNVLIATVPTRFRPALPKIFVGHRVVSGVLSDALFFLNSNGEFYVQGVTESNATIILRDCYWVN